MSKDVEAKRAKALRDLVELRTSVPQAITALSRFPWDSDNELYTLTRANIYHLFDLYKTEKLSAINCRLWAEALEGRDDLGLESGFEEVLNDFLFEAATPKLTEPFNLEFIAKWTKLLTSESR